eukprot:4222802-Pyramimonas_sp.AAC.1
MGCGMCSTWLARQVARLKAEKATRDLTPKENLVLRLNDEYPKDVGILSAYFLNYVRLYLCLYLLTKATTLEKPSSVVRTFSPGLAEGRGRV